MYSHLKLKSDILKHWGLVLICRILLQPSSEVLYLTMFKEFRTSLTPVVLEMVQAVQNPCDPEDMVAILSKDAGESNLIVFDVGYDDMYDHDNTYNTIHIMLVISVYNAVGLSAFDLFDDVDFDKWFSTQLLQEHNIKHQK